MSVCAYLPESPPVPRDRAGSGLAVEQLFGYAVEQITVAASESWPGERFRLVEHVPSVTGYVHRVDVGGQVLFAKYSYLGRSLVSVLRGRCGNWDRVRAAQRAYVMVPGSLLEREAAQLRLLHRLGRPRVHRVVAFRRGVLFTEAVTGDTLAQLLCAEPHRTAELLGHTWVELGRLHQVKAAQQFTGLVAIEERSIEGTFARKFTGTGAKVNLDQLPAVLAPLRRIVTRLGRLWATTSKATAPVLVYGDLKPEHVVFDHHVAAPGRPVFIDPGMSYAHAMVDAAKLISRTILLLIGLEPHSREAIVDGLAAFVDDQTGTLSTVARQGSLRELTLLWLTDMVNIVTTYLSAPAELPLPAHAEAVLSQVRTVGTLVDQVSAELASGTDSQSVWRLGLSEAVGHARLAATA